MEEEEVVEVEVVAEEVVGSMAAPAAVEARAAAATRGSDWTIPSAPSACVPGRAAAAPSSC